jgi:hypothetical protein
MSWQQISHIAKKRERVKMGGDFQQMHIIN